MNENPPMGLVGTEYYFKILADLKKLRKKIRVLKEENKKLKERITELERIEV